MKQDQIDDYIAGRLGESEAQAFEEYCLGHPEFARHVEYEQRLKAGITQVARGSTAEFVRSNHPLGFRLAAAAGLLLAIISIFYLWNNPLKVTSRPVMAAVQTDAQRNGSSMRLALVRGTENTPTLQPGIVRVEIVGLFDLGFHYSVTLEKFEHSQKIETVATLYSQHPTSPVTLEVMIDSDQLRQGVYSLRVKKQASDEESLDFGFLK
jgi:hypothetical protein